MTSSSRRRALILLSVVLGMAGCGSSVVVRESPDGSVQSPTASTPTGDWGPLALVAPSDGADTARTEGVIRIAELCVVLEAGGQRTLLVWPANRTAWSAASGEVAFMNFDGTIVSVGDGARVAVGGSGESFEESELTVEAWLGRTPWVSRPAGSCRFDAFWFVGAVSAIGS